MTLIALSRNMAVADKEYFNGQILFIFIHKLQGPLWVVLENVHYIVLNSTN